MGERGVGFLGLGWVRLAALTELAWRKFGAQHFIIVFGCLISDYVRDLSNNLGGVDFKKFRF